ncbi:MAG: RNA-guided endonuclease TnpB family protein [Candidatus Micrarchaeota archaeon]
MLAFRYRIYPSKKQQANLNNQLDLSKQAYNYLLQKAKEKYKKEKKSLSKYEMNNHLLALKQKEQIYAQLHSQALQNISDRLSKAFSSFFRRVKEKKQGKKIRAGFPRFKHNAASLTYPQSGFQITNAKRLYLSKVGNIPIKLHRQPKGEQKTLTIKKSPSGKWHISISCVLPKEKFDLSSKPMAGLDAGIENFATLSDGAEIENPRFFNIYLPKIKKVQKLLSRKKNMGKNRLKAKLKLAILHEKIDNRRKDFLHKLSFLLTHSYSLLAIEKLNIQSMLKNKYLSRSIMDASWASFMAMLAYKAESAGCRIVAINPKDTSKKCSNCGHLQSMPLHKRQYGCPACQASLGRDVNAAKNILNAALKSCYAVGHTVNACQKRASTLGANPEASYFNEAGTISHA